ncbi:hypothetical protein [Flavihumibacter fluvii]|uniref:hypothetical protein n=1 Tax=Flavihumibacter fluvii TaxID=2838157 RepID=UPI001BDED029|nr:hypothetical protein [Flavihumibacter fluvii]ULQ54239.1 hypothetical protein KJS93_07900 [Flavihumibacter fluvii]
MKKIVFTALILLLVKLAEAQPINLEGMAGDDYLFYQHLIAKKLSARSRLGILHIANVSIRYETDIKKGGRPNEVMNQAYITTSLNKHFTLLTGMYYNHVNGIRASAAVQFAWRFKNGLFIALPRADIQHRGSVDVMTMLEYQPLITKRIKLYTRLQVMSNYGPFQHNRSYQRLRLGVDIKGTQLGVGVNIDEYGRESTLNFNTGIFIRKEII